MRDPELDEAGAGTAEARPPELPAPFALLREYPLRAVQLVPDRFRALLSKRRCRREGTWPSPASARCSGSGTRLGPSVEPVHHAIEKAPEAPPDPSRRVPLRLSSLDTAVHRSPARTSGHRRAAQILLRPIPGVLSDSSALAGCHVVPEDDECQRRRTPASRVRVAGLTNQPADNACPDAPRGTSPAGPPDRHRVH